MTDTVSSAGSFDIHTEQRGGHWVGWATPRGSDRPERSVLLVAGTKAEAEARAKAWAEKQARA